MSIREVILHAKELKKCILALNIPHRYSFNPETDSQKNKIAY